MASSLTTSSRVPSIRASGNHSGDSRLALRRASKWASSRRRRVSFGSPGSPFSPFGSSSSKSPVLSPSPVVCRATTEEEQETSTSTSSPADAELLDDELPPLPPPSIQDTISIWITNILQIYGGKAGADNAPVAEGTLDDLVGGPLFLALHKFFQRQGGVYKLAFGPKAFIVLNDPRVIKTVLQKQPMSFDKGVLAEILSPIMGKGLIPADLETWKVRRRVVAPGLHDRYLNRMTETFVSCTNRSLASLRKQGVVGTGSSVDLEMVYGSLALDIIGLAVFNYDFKSVQERESDVVKAVYRVLREAEHRSTFYVPYWDLPFASYIFSDQIRFREDLESLDKVMETLIASALGSRTELTEEELLNRDYEDPNFDPSLLRFIMDMKLDALADGSSASGKVTDALGVQLRDDLVTLLIAGHETTAAVLTWATHEMMRQPEIFQKVREEVDSILGPYKPGEEMKLSYDQVKQLTYTKLVVMETLRLYPEPPVLIRRALQAVELDFPGVHPPVEEGQPAPTGPPPNVVLPKGVDILLGVYSLHRNPDVWGPDAETFRPDRFLEAREGSAGWEGYKPPMSQDGKTLSFLSGTSMLYPNETHFDFGFIPFGGGQRKCVGDAFAVAESVVALAGFARNLDIKHSPGKEEVGMVTGATIHTDGGLQAMLTERKE
ncbi:cytochrome P450 [Pseudoscourfieldia marina]